jgi:hypothetical protein
MRLMSASSSRSFDLKLPSWQQQHKFVNEVGNVKSRQVSCVGRLGQERRGKARLGVALDGSLRLVIG